MAVISSSSSDQSSESSAGSQGYFICTHCFKPFRTGQALGGHQNAHWLERSLEPTPKILGSVLNHPLPDYVDDDEVDDKFVTVEEVTKHEDTLVGSRSAVNSDSTLLYGSRSAVNFPPTPVEINEPEPELTDAEEEIVRGWLTLNLFGLSESQIRGDGAGMGSGGVELRSAEIDESIDLELSLKIAPVVLVDLELKLGF